MRRRTTKSLPLLIAASLLLAPLAGCSAMSGSSSVPDAGRSADSAAPSVAEDGSAGSASSEATAERSVIRTGEISIEVSDPAAAADDVTEIAEAEGGTVEALTVRRTDGAVPASAELTLRVPADRIDPVFTELESVGSVVSQNRSATDVTAEHVDLEARVDALQESVDRLTDLMSGAASTGELIEAEAALSERQQELDGLRAQLQALEGQVDEATIWVSLGTKSALPGGGPANFWEGLLAGIGSLGTAGSGALVLLGILLPWLVVAAIVTFGIIFIVRASRRRRTRRIPVQQPPAPEAAAEQAPDDDR